MRYFKDRTEAGKLLAESIGTKYAHQSCAVVSLNAGGLVVGAEVAKALHASLYLLPVSSVLLSEQAASLDRMTTASVFSSILDTERNHIDEITRSSEVVLGHLQIENFLKNSALFSDEGAISKFLLSRHTIIVVSDGIANGLSISLADSFFRPIATRNIVVAAPICNADLTERVHDMTREFYYLESIQSDYPVGHYYEADDTPTPDAAVEIMSNISLQW